MLPSIPGMGIFWNSPYLLETNNCFIRPSFFANHRRESAAPSCACSRNYKCLRLPKNYFFKPVVYPSDFENTQLPLDPCLLCRLF